MQRQYLSCLALLALAIGAVAPAAQAPVAPRTGTTLEGEIGPGEVRSLSLRLRAGESADVAVIQQGVDLVVDLIGPDGSLLDSVDSPNGRDGPEPVAVAASAAGDYTIRIRPISPEEPRGRFTLQVTAFRDRAATARLAAERRRVRDEASDWLRPRSAALPASGVLPADAPLAPFDAIAAEARIVALGEATHGSREPNDLRLSLVRRLVERHGYRLIALEASASRWRELAGYVSGAEGAPPADREPEAGWIGVRAQAELREWVRRWNLAHPNDRVAIVGVDPQDSRRARGRLDAFIAQAYGAEFAAAWAPASAELAAADDQTAVFGNSDVGAPVRRQMLETYARLRVDAPLLAERFGEAAVAEALAAAGELMQFADFNGGLVTPSRSRDWYMAINLLAAMRAAPMPPKTIYWAHNAHVSAAPTRWGPTGAVLRQATGCGYRAVAITFGQGAFVAQDPNDPDNRLLVSTLGPAGEETIEQVVAGTGPGARFAAWECGAEAEQPPPWLREARPMRWVGGIYAPDTPSSGSYRTYRLAESFDAIAYLPRVTAEDPPSDRPRVPPRPRRAAPSQ